jgi:hypothetical protein
MRNENVKMLLIEKKARLKWNGSNRKKYVELGYVFTAWTDEFLVEIKDITPTTRAIIVMKCDYCDRDREMCFKKYSQILIKSETKKDTCGETECVSKKKAESNLIIYGHVSPTGNAEVQKKRVKTTQDRYGEQYTSTTQIPEFQNKMKETNLERYGTEYAASSEIVRRRIAETSLEKYGSENFMGTEGFNDKTKATNLERYGFVSHTQTEEYREKYSGENSPSWNYDLTDEEREFKRGYSEYHQWRKDVYKKDSYTCQCCGSKEKIAAHHKDSYHWCKERRTDVSNGVVLCFLCHWDFHKEYGLKFNTEAQFEKFMNSKL